MPTHDGGPELTIECLAAQAGHVHLRVTTDPPAGAEGLARHQTVTDHLIDAGDHIKLTFRRT